MCQNNQAIINLTNNTGLNGTFTICHRYGDNTPQSSGPVYIAAGATAANILTVNFNSGFLCTGQDYWWVGFETGSSAYASEGSCDDPKKQCTLESEDIGGTLPFSVTMTTFFMYLTTGGCQTDVNPIWADTAKNAKLSFKKPNKTKK